LKATKQKNTFTQREVGDSANNLVVRAMKATSLGELSDARLRKLRTYSQAALAPMLKHVDEEVIRPEELVIILATAALFVQMTRVMRTSKMPMGPAVEDIYEGREAVILPERYLETPEPRDDEILPQVQKKKKK
jgi:hypothetical protein